MEETFDFSNITPAVTAFANFISSKATEEAGFPPGWGQRVLDQYLRAYSHYPPGTFVNAVEDGIACMEQNQSDHTGHLGQYDSFRQSQVEGRVEGMNDHSGYELMPSTAHSNVGCGEPVHYYQEQPDTNMGSDIGEPFQQRVQYPALLEQEPFRHRQLAHGHRVSSIHFNELKNVWRPGDRLHIPVLAQLHNGRKLPGNGKSVLMSFICRNFPGNDISWERRFVGFDDDSVTVVTAGSPTDFKNMFERMGLEGPSINYWSSNVRVTRGEQDFGSVTDFKAMSLFGPDGSRLYFR